MGLGDLFKSKAERDKELRKERRRAFRQAENAVDTVKERVGNLKTERDRSWNEAREYLKAGQKAAAQRCLQSVRATELMVDQLEKKRWVFEQLLTRLESSKSDLEFSQALRAINAVVEIDPETVADVLDEVQDKLGEQVDVDKIWNKMFDREMAGTERASDMVPTVEDMMRDLEDEVVADVRGGKAVESESGGGSPISEEIGEGRAKLKKLLEDEK
jgi:hypothetical protein